MFRYLLASMSFAVYAEEVSAKSLEMNQKFRADQELLLGKKSESPSSDRSKETELAGEMRVNP